MQKKLKAEYSDIIALENVDYERLPTLTFRNLLDNVQIGCYVEAESTKQAGRVASVIRNMKGIPVCLKVYTAEGERDFISVDRISMWEPYDTYIPNETYDENFKESFQ